MKLLEPDPLRRPTSDALIRYRRRSRRRAVLERCGRDRHGSTRRPRSAARRSGRGLRNGGARRDRRRARVRRVGHGQDRAGPALPQRAAIQGAGDALADGPLLRARVDALQGDRSADRRARPAPAAAAKHRSRAPAAARCGHSRAAVSRYCWASRKSGARLSPCSIISTRSTVRRRAAEALRDLLCALAERAPLVLFIDDVQWGDADSAAILQQVLRQPDGPQMLLIAACRSEDAAGAVLVKSLRETSAPQLCEIGVDRLSHREAASSPRNSSLEMMAGPATPTRLRGTRREARCSCIRSRSTRSHSAHRCVSKRWCASGSTPCPKARRT